MSIDSHIGGGLDTSSRANHSADKVCAEIARSAGSGMPPPPGR